MNRCLPGIALLLLAGCAAHMPARDASLPAAHVWKKNVPALPTPPHDPADPRAAGWSLNEDPALSELIARAMTDNPDIQELFARREAARAGVRAARADLWPLVRIGLRSQRTHIPDRDALQRDVGDVGPGLLTLENPATRHALDLEASYEIDLWGRLRSAHTATVADLRASEQDVRDRKSVV